MRSTYNWRMMTIQRRKSSQHHWSYFILILKETQPSTRLWMQTDQLILSICLIWWLISVQLAHRRWCLNHCHSWLNLKVMSFTSTLITHFMSHLRCTSQSDYLGQSSYMNLSLLAILYLLPRRYLSRKFLINMANNIFARHTKKPTSKMKRIRF